MIPSSLRLKKNNSTQENLSSLDQSEKQNLPSSLRPKKQQEFPFEGENDLEREIERNIAQQTSRIGETLAGAPGDINSIVEGITGLPVFGLLGKFLPTSGKLKEVSEHVTKGHTEPQNEFEERMGEVQKDIASFMIPGSKQYSMLRNIGIPLAANLAKEGIKLKGEEKMAEGAKMGLMVVMDLISNRNGMGGGAKKFAGNLFNEMEKKVPKGLSIKASNLESHLNEIAKEQSKGGSRPSTIKSLEKVKEIKNEINNGKIDLKSLVEYRHSINEAIDDLGGFEYFFKPKQKEKIIKNLQEVKGSVIRATEEYAQKFDPELLNLSRSANEAWAAYEKSNKIGNFLNKYFGKKALGTGVKTVLGIGAPLLSAGVAGKLVTGVAGIPLTVGYQGIKILSRIQNSPTLRKYYGDILSGSIKGNIGQVSRSLKALDKELEDEGFIGFED